MIIFYKPTDEGRSVWAGERVDALGVGSWSMGIELGAQVEGKQQCYNNQMAEGKQNTNTQAGALADGHNFFLRRCESSSASFVQVDFSPVVTAQQDSSLTPAAPQATHPVFNLDGHFFTPAFTLPLEKEKTVRHEDTYLKLHLERVAEMSLQREELFVARPSRSNSYCCICRTPFDDYLTHVNIPQHQKLLRASPFCVDITGLTQRFNSQVGRPVESKKVSKTQHIKKRAKKAKESPKLSSCQSSTTIFVEEVI